MATPSTVPTACTLTAVTIDFDAIERYVRDYYANQRALGRTVGTWMDKISEYNCPETLRLYVYRNVYDFKQLNDPQYGLEHFQSVTSKPHQALLQASVEEVWDCIGTIYTAGTFADAVAHLRQVEQQCRAERSPATTVRGERAVERDRDMETVGRIRSSHGLQTSAYVGVNVREGYRFRAIARAYELANEQYNAALAYQKLHFATLNALTLGQMDKTAIQYLQRRIQQGKCSVAVALPVSIIGIEDCRITTRQYAVLTSNHAIPADVKRAYWVRLGQGGNFFLAY